MYWTVNLLKKKEDGIYDHLLHNYYERKEDAIKAYELFIGMIKVDHNKKLISDDEQKLDYRCVIRQAQFELLINHHNLYETVDSQYLLELGEYNTGTAEEWITYYKR